MSFQANIYEKSMYLSLYLSRVIHQGNTINAKNDL